MKLYTVYHEIGGEWFPTCEVPMSREDALKEADELLRLGWSKEEIRLVENR